MSSISLDDHALSTLEPEERAAIAGGDVDPADKAALEAIVNTASTVLEDPEDGDDDETADDAAAAAENSLAEPAAAAAPAPAAAAPAAPAETVAEVEPAAPAPRAVESAAYQATLPTDYNDRVAKLAEDRKDLRARRDAGEIDMAEFDAESERLGDERDALNKLALKAEISQETEQQNAQRQWRNAIESQFRAAKADGIDYATDAAKQADLDTFVKVLANNPATADKPMEWFLEEAHKRVKALHGVGIAMGVSTAADVTTKPAAAKPADRKPPVAAIPKGLSQVAGGDGPGDLAGEFAEIDRLEGDDLESAIGKMTPVQRERYMRGQ